RGDPAFVPLSLCFPFGCFPEFAIIVNADHQPSLTMHSVRQTSNESGENRQRAFHPGAHAPNAMTGISPRSGFAWTHHVLTVQRALLITQRLHGIDFGCA